MIRNIGFRQFLPITLAIIIFILIPAVLFASDGLQVNWPTSPMGRNLDITSELHHFVAYLYEWGIGLGGIAVFIMLVIAGFQYLTSVGDPAKVTMAVAKIRSAILGLILLLSSWIILDTINPQLTQLRPLPGLWEEDALSPWLIDIDDLKGPPCEYVLLYGEKNYRGLPSLLSPSQDKAFEGEGPFFSGRGFTKLTDEDRETIGEENRLGLQEEQRTIRKTYDDKGNEAGLTGSHKEGGLCQITFYYRTGWWAWSNACGRVMGNSMFPNRDFSESFTDDKEVTCFTIKDLSEQISKD